jgi:hypothetical protein
MWFDALMSNADVATDAALLVGNQRGKPQKPKALLRHGVFGICPRA